MSLVYVFAASGMEGQPVKRIGMPSASKSSLRCGSHDVVLVTGAMGPKNAKNKAEAALSASVSAARKPDLVLIIGLCGGLTASLPEGTVVVYTECRSTEAAKPLFRCSEPIVDQVIEQLKSSTLLWDRVVGITSPRIATTGE